MKVSRFEQLKFMKI